MVFTGTYEHTIDTKNRLAIPSEIRKQLNADAALRATAGEGDGTVVLYMTPDQKNNVLMIWPEKTFDDWAVNLKKSTRSTSQMLPYEKLIFSISNRAEMDKQGRIRLSEKHLNDYVMLDNDVAVVGVNDHLEVWNRDAWTAYLTQTLQQNPDLQMHPHEAMRDESLT